MTSGHTAARRPRFWASLALSALLAITATGLRAAESAASSPADQHRADIESAMVAAQKVQVLGPADIPLKDQGTLKLPAGYGWIPEPQASQVMKAWGNQFDEREIGLIFPTAEDQGWVVVAQYEPSGYIKDDDAKNWKIDEMFQSFKEGTEAANENRRQRGFPELEIVDWVERPAYDAATHRLIWSMSIRHKGASADERQSINYNTYALGREGYVTLNMITGTDTIAQEKVHAQTLIGGIDFAEGKRYADFNASTDKTAEYGLAALVGGIAAKKLGFFALAAGLFAKFAKVIALAVIGGGVALRKLFGKKNPPDTAA